MEPWMVRHGLRFARKHPKLVVKTSYRLARRPGTVITGVKSARTATGAVRDPEIREQTVIAALALAGAGRRLRELSTAPEPPRRRVRTAAVTAIMLAASALLGYTAARKVDD